MSVRSEIDERVAKLSPQLQEQVLHYISALEPLRKQGERGAELARFAGSLDGISALEMSRAIEEECERVDADHW
jgi:hypothetical protein